MDEDAIVALLTEMVRSGVIPEDVVHDAADECEARDQAMSAHRLRCLIISASGPTSVERVAEQRRPKLTVTDGGKST